LRYQIIFVLCDSEILRESVAKFVLVEIYVLKWRRCNLRVIVIEKTG